MRSQQKDEKDINPEEQLIRAKAGFLKSADNIQPLGFVDKQPVFSLGCAFLLGFGLMRFGKTTLSAAPLLLETGNLLIKSFLKKS